MRRDPRVYLLDIQESARAAIRFTAGKTFANDLDDDMLRMAVERAFSIIGFRNVLMHQYAERSTTKLFGPVFKRSCPSCSPPWNRF